jgi:hypothetical protein
MPGAWLQSCISRLKLKKVFNSHTRANHPLWGLGRRMFLDNPLNIKVQMLVNRTLFSKEPCVMWQATLFHSHGCIFRATCLNVTSWMLLLCCYQVSTSGQISYILPLLWLLLFKDNCMLTLRRQSATVITIQGYLLSLPYPFTSHSEYITLGAFWHSLCL